MHSVRRNANVPFTAEQMFELVADVEAYPQFLSGIREARIHSRDAHGVVASILVAEGPLKFEFETRNELTRPHCITMHLTRGPFRELSGEWRFADLGDARSSVSLHLNFAFASRAMDLVVGAAFEALASGLVNTFVARARAVYARGPG